MWVSVILEPSQIKMCIILDYYALGSQVWILRKALVLSVLSGDWLIPDVLLVQTIFIKALWQVRIKGQGNDAEKFMFIHCSS
jgi:hypothetical protein